MTKIHLITRRPFLLTTLAAAALAFTAASFATSSSVLPTAEAQGGQGKHEEKESALEQAMQTMQGAEKRLGKALKDKDLAAALPLVVEMERAAQAAKVETPPKAAELTDAKKKAEFVAGFRKQVISLQKALCDLEVAAIDGKADDATRIFETVIKPAKKEGHAKYKGD